MIKQIWSKTIIGIIQMEAKDVADSESPLPLILKMQWNHYIGFYFEEIKSFFAAYAPYPLIQNQFWVEIVDCDGHFLQLDGTEIVSNLAVLNQSLPLLMKCHHRKAELKEQIDLKKFYKNNLKQSTSLRYGKMGASTITLQMSVENIDKMFINFRQNKFQDYLGSKDLESTNLGYHFIVSRTDKIDKIPVRILSRDSLIERGAIKSQTLTEFLSQILKSSSQDAESVLDKFKLKLHGVAVKQGNVQFSYLQKYCHPDGYLYFTY